MGVERKEVTMQMREVGYIAHDSASHLRTHEGTATLLPQILAMESAFC